MTIHLPTDIERSLEVIVHNGLFASVDDAMTEAARMLLHKINQRPQPVMPTGRDIKPDLLLGSMPDAADELDEIVADAMKRRREEPWRTIPGE